MKKILSVMLAVLMIAGLCTMSAFAANEGLYPDATVGAGVKPEDFNGGSSSTDVNITVSGNKQNRYAVEISFKTDVVFTYSTGSVWDPQNHVYVPGDTSESTWSGEGSVQVVNHSDLPVDYNVASQNVVSTYGNLSIQFAGDAANGTLAACVAGGTPASAALTYTVEGQPTVSEINTQKLGEVVVTISKAA